MDGGPHLGIGCRKFSDQGPRKAEHVYTCCSTRWNTPVNLVAAKGSAAQLITEPLPTPSRRRRLS
jgi:hypothetical protein